MAAETLEERLTVLEIGAGKDYKRAKIMAEMHPNWTYIVIDPDISWHEKSPLPNLKIMQYGIPDALEQITDKVDRVEMYHTSSPMTGLNGKIVPKIYSWLNNDENPWLAEKHEVWIIDNTITTFYHNDREGFDVQLKKFKEIVEKRGYTVELELVENYEKLSDWDKRYLRSDPHLKLRLIKDKKADKNGI